MTDERLAALARGGDAQAAERLLERYKNAVRSIARNYFLAGGDAEDLAQEGMIGVYGAIASYREEGGMSFKNFAYLCAHRRILGAVRGASRKKHAPLNGAVPLFETEYAPAEHDPEAALISVEEREEFLRLLEKTLSPAEYGALRLYMDGLSIAEIAARRGGSEKSSENAVQRAKAKVRALLAARRQ